MARKKFCPINSIWNCYIAALGRTKDTSSPQRWFKIINLKFRLKLPLQFRNFYALDVFSFKNTYKEQQPSSKQNFVNSFYWIGATDIFCFPGLNFAAYFSRLSRKFCSSNTLINILILKIKYLLSLK